MMIKIFIQVQNNFNHKLIYLMNKQKHSITLNKLQLKILLNHQLLLLIQQKLIQHHLLLLLLIHLQHLLIQQLPKQIKLLFKKQLKNYLKNYLKLLILITFKNSKQENSLKELILKSLLLLKIKQDLHMFLLLDNKLILLNGKQSQDQFNQSNQFNQLNQANKPNQLDQLYLLTQYNKLLRT